MGLTTRVVSPEGKQTLVTAKVARLLRPRGYRVVDSLYDGGDVDAVAWVADATIAEVLDWVGEDAEGASEALRVEQGKDKPRASLVKKLEAIITADASSEPGAAEDPADPEASEGDNPDDPEDPADDPQDPEEPQDPEATE